MDLEGTIPSEGKSDKEILCDITYMPNLKHLNSWRNREEWWLLRVGGREVVVLVPGHKLVCEDE